MTRYIFTPFCQWISILKILLFVMTLLVVNPIWSQKLNSKEIQILSIVESNHARALEFLEKSVNINSGTMNLEGVKAAGKQFMEAYSAQDLVRPLESPM